jgi:hypothetical protein
MAEMGQEWPVARIEARDGNLFVFGKEDALVGFRPHMVRSRDRAPGQVSQGSVLGRRPARSPDRLPFSP